MPFLIVQTYTGLCECDVVDRQQRTAILDRRVALGADQPSVALSAMQVEELADGFPELGQCHAMGRLHGNLPAG
jgi:hypothetical protein